MSAPHYGLQPQLLTGNPETGANGTTRVRVDGGRSGFWAGHEFRISYPLSIPTSDVVVLKVVSSVDFILQLQNLSSDAEGITFEAYRSTQGTEGGVYGVTVPQYKNNFQSNAPEYTSAVAITTGGTFTPSSDPVETIRVRVSGATAQQTTVSQDAIGERGLPAGTFYLVFKNITGSGTALGVYNLLWEERP